MAPESKQIRGFYLISFAVILTLTNHVILSETRYTPRQVMSQRQDFEDDEDMDQEPSASYQNRDNDNQQGGPSSDGYEDNEPDGPYGETPREEEGQADLERFFDDHLGASERDGMDKENLPSTVVPIILPGGAEQMKLLQWPPLRRAKRQAIDGNHEEDERNGVAGNNSGGDTRSLAYGRGQYPRHRGAGATIPKPLPGIAETNYVKFPDAKLIITRQITSSTPEDGSEDKRVSTRIPQVVIVPGSGEVEGGSQMSPGLSSPTPSLSSDLLDRLDANGSEIIVAEDDGMDKVYVTNLKNKRFKIPALGGFDPEEDFRHASMDIQGSGGRAGGRRAESRRQSRSGRESSDEGDAGGPESRQKIVDITFNDPETDTLFNDASELDEVTFAKDDPYQTDLEAEMRQQAYDVPGTVGRPVAHEVSAVEAGGQRAPRPKLVDELQRDEEPDEESWQEPSNHVAKQQLERQRQTKRPLSRPAVGRRTDDDLDDELDSEAPQQTRQHPERRRALSRQPVIAQPQRRYTQVRPQAREDDDAESSWLNDGADEMEIPSQSHQDKVLERAARQEALAKRLADSEAEAESASPGQVQDQQRQQQQQQQQHQPEQSDQQQEEDDGEGENNKQMPNAEYLKNDLKDFDYKSR